MRWITLAFLLTWITNAVSFAANAEIVVDNRDFVISLPVDINSANALTLQRVLIGVGEKKAQQIVDFRNQQGDFLSIEELTKVKGIGPKTLEKNLGRLYVR